MHHQHRSSHMGMTMHVLKNPRYFIKIHCIFVSMIHLLQEVVETLKGFDFSEIILHVEIFND